MVVHEATVGEVRKWERDMVRDYHCREPRGSMGETASGVVSLSPLPMRAVNPGAKYIQPE